MLPIALPLFAASPVQAAPRCTARQLAVTFDGQDGAFNGMSHSGALMVVRNKGVRACSLPARPRLLFRDAHGRPLPVTAKLPVPAQPAPATVRIAGGASASAPLRWVSGEVYDNSRCPAWTSVAMMVGKNRLVTPFGGRLCGPARGAIAFDQPPLSIAP